MNAWLKQSMLLRLLIPCLALLGVVGWLFSLPLVNAYPDLVTARAYYEDSAGREDIQSVREQSFTPFTGPLFLGNNIRPVWLKVTLAPSERPDWLLHVQSNLVNHAEVYQPDGKGGWRRDETGTRHAFRERALDTLTPTVWVHPAPDRATTIYLRVVTPTTPIYVMALNREDTRHFDSLLVLIGGFFLGLGLMLGAFSGLAWLISRDPLWALDALVNLVGLFMLGLHLGLAAKWLWPDSVNLTNQIGMVANCGFVALVSVFMIRLMQLFALRRWMLWTYGLTLLIFPVELFLIAKGQGHNALAINNLMVLLQVLWIAVLIARARHADWMLLSVFRFCLSSLLIYNVWWSSAIVLHLQNGNLGALYPNLPTSMFSMTMMLIILGRHTQLRIQEAARLALEKQEAEYKLQFERQRHEETNNFLGMVLHEVKSPLNYIRMAASNLERELSEASPVARKRLQGIHQSVDVVDEVLERSLEVDSLEQGGLQLRPTALNVAMLVQGRLDAHVAAARFHASLPEALVVTVDSDVLALILRNLLDNAVKYSPAESTISVSLWQDASTWCLQVRNVVGQVGFPDATQLFSKYYRSPLAMRGNGMGLGLYWVAGAAQRMGGAIHYTREENNVVFTLCLPI